MSAVLEQVKRDLTLSPTNCALAEQWRQDWVISAEAGTNIEDVLRPAYWAHVAAQMQKFDRIEVRLITGEWTADLIVKDVGRNWAAMHLIKQHMLDDQKMEDLPAQEHEVIWRGPTHKHAVKRLSDGAILQEGFSNKSEAIAWIANHERVT